MDEEIFPLKSAGRKKRKILVSRLFVHTFEHDFHQSARKIHGFPSTTMMVLFRHLLYNLIQTRAGYRLLLLRNWMRITNRKMAAAWYYNTGSGYIDVTVQVVPAASAAQQKKKNEEKSVVTTTTTGI